jgi:hypothetical protein
MPYTILSKQYIKIKAITEKRLKALEDVDLEEEETGVEQLFY